MSFTPGLKISYNRGPRPQKRRTERSEKTNQNMKKTFTLTIMGLSALALVTGCQTSRRSYAYQSSYSPAMAEGGSEATGVEYDSHARESSASAEISASQNERESKQTVIPLYEETVRTGTREVDGGTVRLRKIVKTETVNQPVQVRHETVVIDREPASGSVEESNSGEAFKEQEIVIHLKKEEPVIETQVVKTGQIVARKRMESKQENVQRKIRRDEIDVVKEGNPQNVTISKEVLVNENRGAASSPGGQSRGEGRDQR
jgi:stress response protein YsnF